MNTREWAARRVCPGCIMVLGLMAWRGSTGRSQSSYVPLETWNVEVVAQMGGVATAVAAEGDFAYFCIDQSLVILDVSDPSSAVPVGRLVLPDRGVAVTVSGGFAYIGSVGTGMYIVDVSDPAQPSLRGGYRWLGSGSDIRVVGDRAYVVDVNTRLWIFDVSDPSSPTLLGSGGERGYSGIDVAGNIAAIASTQQGLVVIDVADPANPAIRSTVASTGRARDVRTSGALAVVAADGLFIVDISNPATPGIVGSVAGQGYYRVFLAGNLAYTLGRGDFRVFDLSNPSAPVFVGVLPSSGDDLSVSGNSAYSTLLTGLSVIDVSNPTSPTFRATYEEFGLCGDVRVSDGMAYVAAGEGITNPIESQLITIDVSNPSLPVRLGSCRTEGDALGLALSGTYAHVFGRNGLQVVDITTPTAPAPRGLYSTYGPYWLEPQRGIEADGNHVYLKQDDVLIVDVTDPASPTLAGQYEAEGRGGEFALWGDRAYVAQNDRPLLILNVNDPSSPVLLGTHPKATNSVDVVGNRAYVGHYGGFHTLDVADPTSPILRFVYSVPSPVICDGVTVEDGRAYVYRNSRFGTSPLLWIVDVTDESSPTLCGTFRTWQGALHADPLIRNVDVHGDLIYAAVSGRGLWILRYTGPRAPATSTRPFWELYR